VVAWSRLVKGKGLYKLLRYGVVYIITPLSVCVLCGSPVWPSPPVVGPLWGPPLCVGPLCGSPVRVPCVGPLCGSPLCGSPVWVPCVGPSSRCVMLHLLA